MRKLSASQDLSFLPTVVGYNNKGLNARGQLLTAQFLNVGSATSFNLSDLKVVGYDTNTTIIDEQGETGNGDFYLYQLNDLGVSQKKTDYWWWHDVYDYDNEEFLGGCWCDKDNNDIVKGVNDKTFSFAEGVWFYVGLKADAGEEFKLVSSGGVAGDDWSYDLRARGNLVGNPMPTDIYLSDVSVSGYDTNTTIIEDQAETGNGDFYFYYLNDLGVSQKKTAYYWWHDVYDYDNEQFLGGCWCDKDNNDIVKDENDVTLHAGDCFWFYVGLKADSGEQFVLEFPSPLANHDAE